MAQRYETMIYIKEKIIDLFRLAFSPDNIAPTIMIVLFIGLPAFFLLKVVFISPAVLLATIVIGFCCFGGGYLLGLEIGKNESRED